MFLRFSRLRFVFIRALILALLIVLLLQFFTLLYKERNRDDPDNKPLSMSSWWSKIFAEDNLVTDKYRRLQIESINNKFRTKEFNWTSIFFSSYKRKLSKIQQRDEQTKYKHHFKDHQVVSIPERFDIFEETLVFGQPKFCSNANIFHAQCPYSNCQWTCEKPAVNIDNHRRASIFHHVDINTEEMSKKVQHRSSNDIWILWIDEANRQIKNLNQYQFNWTLSFRQDSEVSIGTYGILIEQTTTQLSMKKSTSNFNKSDFIQILMSANVPVMNMLLEQLIYTNYRYRHKHALWFVSNCEPQRRLNYYKQLKSSYPIRAFGACVEKQCDRNNDCQHTESHLAMFYLAFESQTCTDYITEKFWRALDYGMIPIVMGPSKQSYLDLGLPSSAYIHVDDYDSVGELANHLHQVANDYLLYREYFRWLSEYEVYYDIRILEPIRMCELCMKLNMQERDDHSFYTNVHEWHRNAC